MAAGRHEVADKSLTHRSILKSPCGSKPAQAAIVGYNPAETWKGHVRCSNQGTFLGGSREETGPHGPSSRTVLFEQEIDIGHCRMNDGKKHIGYHKEALPSIRNTNSNMARSVAGEVDDGHASHYLTLTVDRLQFRVKADHIGGKPKAILKVIWGTGPLGGIRPEGNIAPINVNFRTGEVCFCSSNETANMILMHVGDDNRINLVAGEAQGGEPLREKS